MRTASLRVGLSISAQRKQSKRARASASSFTFIPGLERTSISVTRLIYNSQSGKPSRNASRSSLRFSMSMRTLLSSIKRGLSILILMSPGRIGVPGVTMVPLVPQGVDVPGGVFPRLIGPGAIGAAEGAAKRFVLALSPGLFGESFLPGRDRGENKDCFSRRYFTGNFNSQPVIGRNLNDLFDGHRRNVLYES